MKEVKVYQANNGTLCNTANEALHHDEVDRIKDELNRRFYLYEDDYEIATWIAEHFTRNVKTNEGE